MRLTALAQILTAFERLFPDEAADADSAEADSYLVEMGTLRVSLLLRPGRDNVIFELWGTDAGLMQAVHKEETVAWQNHRVVAHAVFADATHVGEYRSSRKLTEALGCEEDSSAPGFPTHYFAAEGSDRCYGITVTQQGHRINDHTLLRAMRLVEGRGYAKYQHPKSATTLNAVREHWKRISEEDPLLATERPKAVVGTIYGDGGIHRYHVTADGEVHYCAFHGKDEVNTARAAGFNIWR